MDVPLWLWFATVGVLVVLLAVDLFVVDREPHDVGVAEAARWVTFYVTLAVLFGVGVWMFSGGQYAGEYFAGYITEYSLSIDNLFVFVIIMGTFAVPPIHQHKVLLFGILIALVMRGCFIALGAAAISRFSWVFFIFGAFLIYTAWKMVSTPHEEQEEVKENVILRYMRRVLPVTDDYHGSRSVIRIDGKRWFTPLFVVMVAIGTTDLLFALDSIPAIFGLTKEPYLVFTANAFALMGLRQLFFLIGGLLKRLVYLSIGLSVILAFIGVKLILEALHENSLPFINGGDHVTSVPEISIATSLTVIIGVLAVTTVASVLKSRRMDRTSLVESAKGGAAD